MEDKTKTKKEKAADAARVAAAIRSIEEARAMRKTDPKGFRASLRNFAISVGLGWFFSQGK